MNQTNYIVLSGKVQTTPWFDHECSGEKFYMFTLAVKRQSGNVDYVPVMCSKWLFCDEVRLTEGSEITVEGQIRTYNKVDAEGHGHCIMVTFAKGICAKENPNSEDYNYVYLDGRLCKEPVYRITPFGREITDICLAVNRAYGKSDYVNCVCWGRTARFVSYQHVGERFIVEGRFQSRPYIKKVFTEKGPYEEERIAYEISCARVYKEPDSEA